VVDPKALAAAGSLLGVDTGSLDRAVQQEAAARFAGELEAVIKAFAASAAAPSSVPQAGVDTVGAASAAAAALGDAVANAIGGAGLAPEQAAAAAREAVLNQVLASVEGALSAEAMGDMATAKQRLFAATQLPALLLATPSTTTDGVSSASAASASVSEVLRGALSEDDELRLSEVCWELEDSEEPENEALAGALLGLLGMR